MENVKVTVVCTVYNHEKFLRKCLDGFVNQNTNFKYEVLIHDDCSTDNSKSIIEEYYKKYPNIIVPIYARENQYSKSINIINEIMLPKAKGKYLAFCEGDDYWNDYNKLQKQFEYMEKDNECVLCGHNTVIHDLKNCKKDSKFNNWDKIHKMTESEVFDNWLIHTSSYFIRREYVILPIFKNNKCNGDYKRLIHAYFKGKIIVLPDIMSVYNYNNEIGALRKSKNNINSRIMNIQNRINYLKEFNEYTNEKYSEIINKVINKNKIIILCMSFRFVASKEDFKKLKNDFLSNGEYKNYFSNQNFLKRIYYKLVLKNYFLFKILKIIKIKRESYME